MIKNAFNRLINIGVDRLSEKEKNITRFHNLMMSVTILMGFPLVGCIIYYDIGFLYLALALLYISTNILGLYLNSIGLIYPTRLIIAGSATFFMCTWYISFGGFFGQGGSILTIGIIAYITFDNARQYRKLIPFFVYIPFIGSLVYVYFYGETFKYIDWHFDEMIFFAFNFTLLIGLLTSIEGQNHSIENELISKNSDLKNKRNELKRFVYITSNNLKGPLTDVTSITKEIEEDLKKNLQTTALEKLNYARSRADQMTFLVERVLELSNFKAVQAPKKEMLSLRDILENTKQNLSQYIVERNAYIESAFLPEFFCNKTEFVMLFQNFIQNGIKYNENISPHIYISSEILNDTLIIRFRDNGIGIPKEDFNKIFGLYNRLENAKRYQGAGIGLGMCKQIIDNYNGQIEIDSVVGLGSSFKLSFPITHSSPTPTTLATTEKAES